MFFNYARPICTGTEPVLTGDRTKCRTSHNYSQVTDYLGTRGRHKKTIIIYNTICQFKSHSQDKQQNNLDGTDWLYLWKFDVGESIIFRLPLAVHTQCLLFYPSVVKDHLMDEIKRPYSVRFQLKKTRKCWAITHSHIMFNWIKVLST